MTNQLTFESHPSSLTGVQSLHVVGRKDRLHDALPLLPEAVRGLAPKMLKGDPGDHGRTATTYVDAGELERVTFGVLPEVCSRHNSEARTWAYPRLLSGNRSARAGILVMLDDASHAKAAAMAIARTHPTFAARSTARATSTRVVLMTPDGPVSDASLQIFAEAVQHAAHWVDMPPDVLGPDRLVAEAQAIAKRHGASVQVLRRDQIEAQGLGGLEGVGRCSLQEPALVVLDWAPAGATKTVCWVGKGITYDTGGLSLKTKTGMPGMKTDMGGAAGVLAAFEAAVRTETRVRLTAILCIAENSIGAAAIRPDDILTMYSGRTVEVNNTDAEGRLVLADGVAWAVKHREPDVLVDMATLTGAQAAATGKLHAAIYCNDEALEQQAVSVGRATGEMVHPLPFAPELFRKEFASAVADMRNSVKDRGNAQSSCAGQFVGNHLGAYDNLWLHIDMAAPSHVGYRGTGYGVGLLTGLLD